MEHTSADEGSSAPGPGPEAAEPDSKGSSSAERNWPTSKWAFSTCAVIEPGSLGISFLGIHGLDARL